MTQILWVYPWLSSINSFSSFLPIKPSAVQYKLSISFLWGTRTLSFFHVFRGDKNQCIVSHAFPLVEDFFQTFSWLLRENDTWEAIQKQSPIVILIKRCFENMQQIYRRTNVPKCSPVNLLHIFRTAFRKNTYGGLLLAIQSTFTNSYSTRNTRTRSETGFK